jgi:hypothetical protein
VVTKVFASTSGSFLFCLEEIRRRLERELPEFDFLLFYIYPHFPEEDIIPLIEQVFQTDKYLGFSSISSFCNNHIIEKGVVCTAIKFTKGGSVEIFADSVEVKATDIGRLADYFNGNTDAFHFTLFNYFEDVGILLEKLSDRLTYYPINNIIGGLCSTVDKKPTTIYCNGKIIHHGLAILSFRDCLIETGISLGFKPYGITYTVSKGEGNVIHEVDDNRPFSPLIRRFFRGMKDNDIRYLWYAPIYLLDEEQEYLATLRTFKEIREEGVEFYGPVKKGNKFKLSFATPQDLLEEDERVAWEVKKRIQRPELVFNVSCIARQYVLEEHRQREVEIYTNVFNTYLSGFFSFGEIGPDIYRRRLKLFNETSLIAAIRERSPNEGRD